MTAVSKPEAVAMAEIHAMRSLADSVKAQTAFFGEAVAGMTKALERVASDVKEVGDDVRAIDRRLIHVEAAKHAQEIEKVAGELSAALARIDLLESTRDQQKGAKALVDWLRQTAPWLVGIAAAVFLGWKEKVG